MKLIKIEWFDSAQPIPSWMYLSDFEPKLPVKCVSVGFLIHDGEEVKALAPNIGEMDDEDAVQGSGIIHIPTRSIIKISQLVESE